jgi:Cyclin
VTSDLVVSALIYIDRLLLKNEKAMLNETNAKGVLHVALTLATKFNLDRYEKNTIFYGIVVGLQKT